MDVHLSDRDRQLLRDALGEAQRIGMLGDEPLDAMIDRSMGFVRGIPAGTETVVDLGSGGGDPGLVIAVCCPEIHITLVDRRAKRTDLLARLVGRLELSPRVEVVEADVAHLHVRFPERSWDVATSRGFGSPAYTVAHAAPLLPPRGILLVSEPPDSHGERWFSREIAESGLHFEAVEDGIARLIKDS